MKKTGKILAAGCLIVSMLAPLPVYGVTGTGVQISERTGIPVVTAPQSSYENVAISRVSNYVNVRTEPNTSGSIVGKIYNNCAATILATVDGEDGSWYQIQSGTVKGYIKAEYFITGAEAEKIAKEVGTVYVTINTQTLRLREEPSTESRTLTLLSEDAEYVELREEGDFVEIQVDAGLSGYVHKDYIEQRVEFRTAVSLAEEEQQLAESERLKKEAEAAIAIVEELKKTEAGTEAGGSGSESESSGSAQIDSVGLIAANPSSGLDAGQTAGPAGSGQSADAQPAGEQQSGGPQTTTGTQQSSGTQASDGTGQASDTAVGPGAGLSAGESYGPGYSGSGSVQSSPGSASSQSGPGSESSQSGPGSGSVLSSVSSAELISATRTAIVAYARQFLGNPYVYGGTSLTDGADCSGFIMSIFAHFGIETGRSSRDQAANAREISLSEIQPGDLLFYASGDYINHVALYIGGGQVIHASTEKTGIIISTAYYRTPYKAATFLN